MDKILKKMKMKKTREGVYLIPKVPQFMQLQKKKRR